MVPLVVVLLIVGGVTAYWRLMPVLEFRLRNPRGNGGTSPQLLMDGANSGPHFRQLEQLALRPLRRHPLAGDETPQVEIVGPSEPSVTNWITEAESKLRAGRGIRP